MQQEQGEKTHNSFPAMTSSHCVSFPVRQWLVYGKITESGQISLFRAGRASISARNRAGDVRGRAPSTAALALSIVFKRGLSPLQNKHGVGRAGFVPEENCLQTTHNPGCV